jgi:hypothetical protein
VVVVDQPAEDGMEMKEVILKQPGKVGNTDEAEEVVALIPMMTITKHLHAVAVEVQVAVKAGDGLEMKKDIPKPREKDGNIVVAVEEEMMTKMTIKGLHAVGEAAIMMKMKINIKDLHAIAVEV